MSEPTNESDPILVNGLREYRVIALGGTLLIAGASQEHAEEIARLDGHCILPQAANRDEVEWRLQEHHRRQFPKLEAELARLRAENRSLRDKARGDFWLWQGDGEDHLESLVCPVLIRPEHLAELQAQVARLQAEAVAMREALEPELARLLPDEKCLSSSGLARLDKVSKALATDAGSALLRELDDLRDAIRLVISQHTGVPWREVRQADVDGYVEAMRKLKNEPRPA